MMSEPLSLLSAMAQLQPHLLPPQRLLPPSLSPLLRRHPLSKHRQHLHRLRLLRLRLQLLRQLPRLFPHLRQLLRLPQLLLLLRPPPARCCRRLSVALSPITASMPLVLPALATMVVSLAPM